MGAGAQAQAPIGDPHDGSQRAVSAGRHAVVSAPAQGPPQGQGGLRCATPSRLASGGGAASFLPPGDCDGALTNALPAYSPLNLDLVEIDVVFHVIEGAAGQGTVADARIHSQIDVLNEDFRALPGTLGAAGVDTRIRFRLAETDPQGNPTSGITRTNNNTWFNDTGSYWNTLAWDPQRYLNVYTNAASGALGYVPFYPATGPVGANADRVVLLWTAVGRNAPIGPPYDLGRTLTHEVGHYLGLYHTFDGGCGGAACNASGDLICDTAPVAAPHFGCALGAQSCGTPDPVENYMDFSDDPCVDRFSEHQARRMRCTLLSWRPLLARVVPPAPGSSYCVAQPNSIGVAARLTGTGSAAVVLDDLTLSASPLPTNVFGFFVVSRTQALIPNAGGSAGDLCLGAPIGRYSRQVQSSGTAGRIRFDVDLALVPMPTGFVAVQAGETWNFQLWYRDTVAGNPSSNYTDGYSVTFH